MNHTDDFIPLDDPDLPRLLAIALEQLDEGQVLDLAELCSHRPELLDAVARSLVAAEQLAAIRRRPQKGDA